MTQKRNPNLLMSSVKMNLDHILMTGVNMNLDHILITGINMNLDHILITDINVNLDHTHRVRMQPDSNTLEPLLNSILMYHRR